MLVAKLVTVTLVTRVIVDVNETDEDTIAEAKQGFQHKVDNDELLDNLISIEIDTECPYSEED
jgi:hypothetical protein